MPRYIREGRFGKPKTFKTGIVLGTYPKPLLHMSYDAGGHEIHKPASDYSVVAIDELRFILHPDPAKRVPPPAKITVIDLSFKPLGGMDTNYVPAPNNLSFQLTVDVINLLRGFNPFKTVVVDPVTGLSEAIWQHQAVTNSAALADPRKWAGNIGLKVGQVIDYITALPCNSVFLFHEDTEKDELTGKITTLPNVYSRLRNFLGGKFTQFYYQIGGRPVAKVQVMDSGLVQGIGVRWPTFSTLEMNGDFQSLYGKEPDLYV